MKEITKAEYSALQHAYDFFNRRLFAGTLPQVLVTLQRKANARGYFSPERFNGRTAEGAVHELALNPDTFEGRTDEEILSTLVHEMAHVWQEAHGTPPRTCYHDREWSRKMKELGLQPSDTAAPGGKETGQRVSHYIIAGGPFQIVCRELLAGGFKINWQSRPAGPAAAAKKASKTKYTCPTCNQNAWGKPGASLICGICYEEDDGEVTMMEPASEEAQAA